MKLSEFRKDKDTLTGKASDVSRQLAYAGIAVVWIFKQTENGVSSVPKEFLLPIFLFAASLAADLMQYVYAGIAVSIFHRRKELSKNRVDEKSDPEVKAPKQINWATWFLYGLKIVCVMVGYVLLLQYLAAAWVR